MHTLITIHRILLLTGLLTMQSGCSAPAVDPKQEQKEQDDYLKLIAKRAQDEEDRSRKEAKAYHKLPTDHAKPAVDHAKSPVDHLKYPQDHANDDGYYRNKLEEYEKTLGTFIYQSIVSLYSKANADLENYLGGKNHLSLQDQSKQKVFLCDLYYKSYKFLKEVWKLSPEALKYGESSKVEESIAKFCLGMWHRIFLFAAKLAVGSTTTEDLLMKLEEFMKKYTLEQGYAIAEIRRMVKFLMNCSIVIKQDYLTQLIKYMQGANFSELKTSCQRASREIDYIFTDFFEKDPFSKKLFFDEITENSSSYY